MTNIPYSFSTNTPSSTSCYTQVAGCFCSVGNKFLLLKRHSDKPQGGTWCLPAGKIEKGTLYNGIVKRIADFGMFVELVPGKDGLVHISMFPREKQNNLQRP